MMKKPLFLYAFAALLTSALLPSGGNLLAQTNPSAVTLPYTLNNQSSATLPAGTAVHRFSSVPVSRTLAPASGGDLVNRGSVPADVTGGWYHLGADGIGILCDASNQAGALVVAVNTTGQSNVAISWTCKTVRNQASRDNSIALQYRVGTSGNFINVGTGTTYSSTAKTDGHTSAVMTEILPVGANNQSVVQVRWIYWESLAIGGARDKIAIDDISITSGCQAPGSLAATAVTASGATIGWSAVTGASTYEYAVTASSAPPVSGTSTAALSYTANGLSASTNYYVHVRAFCGGGSYSSWRSTAFRTHDIENGEIVTVMTYNLLNYSGADAVRDPSYRTIVNAVQPDIVVVQEISASSGITDFLGGVLNYGSSVYSQGTFINGPDTDNGIYFKGTKFQFISNTAIPTGLRDINQFKLKHLVSGDTLIIYSVHLKAGNTASEAAQRDEEAFDLRTVTNAFAPGKFFIVCGDFNIYGSSEAAYQTLTGNGANPNGKFYDVISMSGTWNSSAYAAYHTQSPRTSAFGGGATGGMDDRFDMFLFSDAIVDPGGFDVVSGTYKAFGNDGAHFNAAINTPPYTVVTSTVAAALHDASDHLPVIVNLQHTGSFARSAAAEVPAQPQTIIYPNPAHTVCYVETTGASAVYLKWSLCDAGGRVIGTAVSSGAAREVIRFDLSGLAPGMYYLTSPESAQQHKLIVE
jgi:endonuclease/exonuclease/phosphatase family metal-dependent hydrolase